MRGMIARYTLLSVLLTGAPALASGLHFEKTAVDLSLKPDQERIDATFVFTNAADHTISILSVTPSCGCTTATLEKKRYAPGEKGVLKAVFDAAGLAGHQEKTIDVITDEPQDRLSILTLRVVIPDVLTISPRLLDWNLGQAPDSKEAALTVNSESHLEVTGVTVDPTLATAELVEGTDAKHLRLVIKPVSTATAMQTLVRIEAQAPGGSPHTYTVFVRVR
jgi:hypothetical protein